MTRVRVTLLAGMIALGGCAALPELDGKPVTALPAAELRAPQPGETRAWALDFGDAGLRRMLAEADAAGLDVATARARFRSADLALSQARRDAGASPSASVGLGSDGSSLNAALRYEPDLFGRFDAALRAASYERAAAGLDLWIARRMLSREVTQGWVSLAEARTRSSRLSAEISADERVIALLQARVAAGETTGAETANRRQAQIRKRGDLASAQTRIAIAEARLRALGVRNIPGAISLKSARRPAVARRSDLGPVGSTPAVCAAWLRFAASDANRAQVLAAQRPRVVVTGSVAATAKTLAGLIAGNALALSNTVRLEGDLLDNGAARTRLDQARLGVAEAEIGWLRAQGQAEISALEAIAAQQTAEASLSAALAAWSAADDELGRARMRKEAGVAGALELAEAEQARAGAQSEVDSARAEAFRAAATLHEALPPNVGACSAPPAL